MINKHLSSYPSFSNEADIFLDKNVKAECMTSVLQCVLAYIQGLIDAIFGLYLTKTGEKCLRTQ